MAGSFPHVTESFRFAEENDIEHRRPQLDA